MRPIDVSVCVIISVVVIEMMVLICDVRVGVCILCCVNFSVFRLRCHR